MFKQKCSNFLLNKSLFSGKNIYGGSFTNLKLNRFSGLNSSKFYFSEKIKSVVDSDISEGVKNTINNMDGVNKDFFQRNFSFNTPPEKMVNVIRNSLFRYIDNNS